MTKNSIYRSEQGKQKIIGFYNKLLQDWPQPSEQYFVETKYGETFILESGNKKASPVVLLHGTGSNSAMWIPDAKRLSEKYHVFAIDILGECGKSSENRFDFKGDGFSDWLLEITEKIRIGKFSVIGCSLGGWIALDFAIRYPDRIDKLVLLATAGVTQVKTSTIFWIILTSVVGKWGFRRLNKMVYGNLDIENEVLEFASLIKKYFKPRPDVLPIFSDHQLKKIATSTFFIGGDHDCFYNTDKTAKRLADNVKRFKYSVLKDTGHVLTNQTERIFQFLSGEK
jgi:pimeloyl-ACP methyl ester carboxylesterase